MMGAKAPRRREKVMGVFGTLRVRMAFVAGLVRRRVRDIASETSGQGTTEYAILVGVLVLMAIVAVMAFRGRLQELWTSFTDGINSL